MAGRLGESRRRRSECDIPYIAIILRAETMRTGLPRAVVAR